jgi:hypothetical protein
VKFVPVASERTITHRGHRRDAAGTAPFERVERAAAERPGVGVRLLRLQGQVRDTEPLAQERGKIHERAIGIDRGPATASPGERGVCRDPRRTNLPSINADS